VTRLREMLDQAAATPPPSSLSADRVYAAGLRRRTLVTMARSALAVATVAAVAGTAYGAVRVAGTAHVAAGGTRTSVASLAVDGDHMYALMRDCVAPTPTHEPSYPASEPPGPPPSRYPSQPPTSGDPYPVESVPVTTPPEPPDEINPGPSGASGSCRARLLASDDGGHTWKIRSDAPGMDWIAAPRHGVLVGGRDSHRNQPGQRVSTDGGRTWRTVKLSGDTVAAVPAGSYADRMVVGNTQKVVAVDARTGRAHPLASQPDFTPFCVETSAVLISSGYSVDDNRHTAKFAVSRDGGRTWTTHALPENGDFAPPSTADGTTLYQAATRVVSIAEAVQEPVRLHPIQVSTDGGATWTGRDVGGGFYVHTGFLTTDGAHVAVSMGRQGEIAFWVSRDRGATYQRQDALPGLPASYEMMFEANTATRTYVAWADGSLTFYRSTDGWNWKKVTIR
jgi:hypothetical protein